MSSLITNNIKENLQTWSNNLDEIESFEPQRLPAPLVLKIHEILKSCHDAKGLEGSALACDVSLKDTLIGIEKRTHHLFLQYAMHHATGEAGQSFEALKLAALAGHVDVLKALLSSGREYKPHEMQKALEEACSSGQISALEVLLTDRRAPSVKTLWSAVLAAAQKGFVDVLRILSSAGHIDHYTLSTALQVAAHYGQVDVLRFLLTDGRELHQTDFQGAVRSAVYHGQAEALAFLIATKGQISEIALHQYVDSAACMGNAKCLSILLSLGRSIPQELREALILKTSRSTDLQCLKLLLAQGPIRAVVRDCVIAKAQVNQRDDVCHLMKSVAVYSRSIIMPSETQQHERSGYYWKFYRSEMHSATDKVLIYKADSSLNQDQLNQLYVEHYPAIEGAAKAIDPSKNIELDQILKDPLLQQLYYDVYQIGTEKYYQTPDPDTLKKQWEKVHGYPLQIEVVKGIVSDRDYAQSFLDNDLTISEQNEFMHDTTIHVINTLKALITNKDLFLSFRKHQREVIGKAIALIDGCQERLSEKEISLLWFGLGVFADRFNDRVKFWDMEETLKTPPDAKMIAEEVVTMKNDANLAFLSKHPRHTRHDFIEKLLASAKLWKQITT